MYKTLGPNKLSSHHSANMVLLLNFVLRMWQKEVKRLVLTEMKPSTERLSMLLRHLGAVLLTGMLPQAVKTTTKTSSEKVISNILGKKV